MRWQQRQRSMLEQGMCILCHGEKGDVMVAQLMFCQRDEFELCVLHHPARASGISTECSVKKVQIPPDMKINTYSWMTDDVVMPIDKCLTDWPLLDYKSLPVFVLCDKLDITMTIELISRL
jgi:hypothetical protein